MRWIDDPSARFPARPFFEAAELDAVGARLAVDATSGRGRGGFEPPLDTDALLVLLERHVDDLDLFADLERDFGPGVEAVTEFRPGRPPVVRVDRRLAGDPRRHVRLRFTLAHEMGHVVLHRDLWEHRFAQPALFPGAPLRAETAHTGAPEPARDATGGRARPAATPPGLRRRGLRQDGWLEWQASFLAGAMLVPADALPASLGPRARRPFVPFAATPEADALVDRVARVFAVSADAAAIRLGQLGWLRDPADAAQRTFWPA